MQRKRGCRGLISRSSSGRSRPRPRWACRSSCSTRSASSRSAPVELQRQPAEPAAAVAPTTPVQRDILVQTELRLRDAPDAEAVLQEAAALAGEQERPAIALLRANLALGSDEAWLRHVNAYLTQFGLEPLQLAEGPGERFWRIRAATPRQVDDGPLVTVIMPAFNAGDSLEFAARSVLDQTWRRLELVIVDDASDDRTAEIAKASARAVDRVTVLHNRANVGPYVSKNFGLRVARGQFITGHDADDWAHPERIERQVRHMLQAGPALKAHLMGMLRCEATGLFSRLSRVTNNSRDGGLQAAFISAFFDARFLHETVGHWDEARFAGDSELIGRVERILGAPVERVHCMGMVCLDSPAGLTNHPEHGYSPERGLSESRHLYREAFRRWHRTLDAHSGRLDFPQKVRRFPIPDAVRVDPDALARCVQGHAALPSRAPMPTA